MTQQSNPQDSPNLLNIRFIGHNVETQSIPIYDLSRVLEAIQRIINKAYIFRAMGADHLLKGAKLANDQRKITRYEFLNTMLDWAFLASNHFLQKYQKPNI